jgi:hypothetical protein
LWGLSANVWDHQSTLGPWRLVDASAGILSVPVLTFFQHW